jgi:hypothetical protein
MSSRHPARFNEQPRRPGELRDPGNAYRGSPEIRDREGRDGRDSHEAFPPSRGRDVREPASLRERNPEDGREMPLPRNPQEGRGNRDPRESRETRYPRTHGTEVSGLDPGVHQRVDPRGTRATYDRDEMEMDPPSGRLMTSFLPAAGVSHEVVQADICRYLGPDATCMRFTNNEVSRRMFIAAWSR